MTPARLPEDPLVRDIVTRLRAMRLGRRNLLRGGITLGASAMGAAALAGCSPKPQYGDGSEGLVRWANWTYYLDFDEETGEFDSLNAFQEATNIAVEYYEDIDENKSFVGTIKDELKLGKDTGYDVFTLTDSSLVRLYELDQLQPFDRSLTPTVNSNMMDLVAHVSFDPEREFSIPYQGGMTGLVYNKQLYPKGIREVSDLWDPELEGKVSLLSEHDDTLALVMLEHGVNVRDEWTEDDWYAALEEVKKYIDNGHVYTVKGNSYTQDLQQERVIAGMAWSGDVAMLNEEAGEDVWEFVIPDSGATMFIDSFCMPTASEALPQVSELIDYYYEPEIAAAVAEYVQYVTPVKGAQEAMEKLDPELAEDPLIFPDDDMQSRIHIPRHMTAEEDNQFSQAYAAILGN